MMAPSRPAHVLGDACGDVGVSRVPSASLRSSRSRSTSGPMGLWSLTRGGWRSGITVALPQADGHDVNDRQGRIAPSSQQRCTAAQPLPPAGRSVVAAGCSPRARARRPRVRPRQGAHGRRSSRPTVVTLTPARSASSSCDRPRCLRSWRSRWPSRMNVCGWPAGAGSPSGPGPVVRRREVTRPRSRTRPSTRCARPRCARSIALTGRRREGPARSGHHEAAIAPTGRPGR